MMAGQAVIGALRVNLGIDTAAFQTGLKQAETKLGKFSISVKQLGLAMAAAGAAVAGAMSAAVMKTSAYADEMWKASQALGVQIEDLSALKHAAEMSGASFEALSTGFRRLSQSMSDAAAGGTSEAAQAFARLGISVTNAEGQMLDSTTIFYQVAEALSQMEDGATKTDLAMSLFGRSGAALIPMLNAGKDGIAAMTDEARRLGLVIDEQTGKAAERFNDNLERLKKGFEAVSLRIGEQLLPYMADLSDLMLELGQDSSVLFKAMEPLIWLLTRLLALVVKVGAAFKGVGMDIKAAGQAISLAAQGEFGKAGEALTAGLSETQKYLAETDAFIDKILAIGSGQGQQQGYIQSRIDSAFAPVKAATEKVTVQMAKVGSSATKAAKVSKDAWDGLRKSVTTVADASENAIGKIEDIGKNLGSTIKGLIDGTKSWKDVLGDVAKVFAQFAMSKLNFGGGMGGLFKGLLGGLFGFANGGAFKVGGSGGVDSQLVAFKASPNETVSVTKPGQALQGANSNSRIEVVPSPYFDVRVTDISRGEAATAAGKAAQATPLIASRTMRDQQTRRIGPAQKMIG